ncbi:MAG: helix-turn-helix transcriptional regulator [Actinobacteria bacterium]|nr:helix-turn-helix transcriptional regulator [Actinomycetota bacterium]
MNRNKATNDQALSDETLDSLASMLKVLADPTRIRLIEMLQSRGPATVSELTAHLPVGQQNVSHQLHVLHRAGMVARRREGVWVRYELCDWSGWWLVRQLVVGPAGPTETETDRPGG